MDWSTLVEDIRRGDEAACEVLYRELRSRQLNYLRRNFPEQAEDLLQESYLRIWQWIRADKVREPQHLATFIGAVVRNALRDYLRSRANCEARRSVSEEALFAVPDPSPDTHRETAARELVALLFERIPSKHATLLERRYIQGHPAGTDKLRILRARVDARQVLEQLDRAA